MQPSMTFSLSYINLKKKWNCSWWNILYSHEHCMILHPKQDGCSYPESWSSQCLILMANAAIILFQIPIRFPAAGNKMSPEKTHLRRYCERNWQNRIHRLCNCTDLLEYGHWGICIGMSPLCFRKLFVHCSGGHIFLLLLDIHWHLKWKIKSNDWKKREIVISNQKCLFKD